MAKLQYRLPSLLLLNFALFTVTFGECQVNIASVCQCTTLLTGLKLDCTLANATEILETLRNNVQTNIESLRISDTPLARLEARSFGNLRIKEIELTGTEIEKIDANAFADQRDTLQVLRLSNNRLTDVPSLVDFPKLQTIDLSKNAISEIPEKVFSTLPSLEMLRLARNTIRSLSRNALNETKTKLTLLDLSDNNFTTIPSQNLRGFQRLAWLDLSGNQIGDLSSFAFVNLMELRELRLNRNRISTILPRAFVNVPNLQILQIKDNLLSMIEPNKFATLENLQVVDLSRNRITRVSSNAFSDMRDLSQIVLDGNLISGLETRSFSNLPRLELVSVQNASLKRMYRNAFEHVPQLVTLLLANNSLTSLDFGMLDGLDRLQQLNLRNNSISDLLPDTFFPVRKSLTTLDLGYNQLTYIPDPLFRDISNLLWLDLSNNKLEAIASNTFKTRVPTILLQGNPWRCDEKLMPFIEYLGTNKVRTFLPDEEDATCKSPQPKAGTPLKNLSSSVKKGNETLNELRELIANPAMFIPGGGPGLVNALTGGALGPGFDRLIPAIPGLQSLAQSIPVLQGVPGFTNFPLPSGPSGFNPALLPNINKLTNPLAKLITGQAPEDIRSDVTGLVQDLPQLISKLPAAQSPNGAAAVSPGIDMTKIPPSVIQYVMRGGKLPGIPDDLMQQLIQKYIEQLSANLPNSADGSLTPVKPATSINGQPGSVIPGAQPSPVNFANLPPLQSLPKEMVQQVLNGGTLPGFTPEQMNAIKAHYANEYMQTMANPAPKVGESNTAVKVALPSNIDLSKIPADVLEDFANGRIPNLARVPPELLSYIQKNPSLLNGFLAKSTPDKNTNTIKEREHIISSTPSSNYNLDRIAGEKKNEEVPAQLAWGLGALVAIVGIVTIVVIIVILRRRQRRQKAKNDESNIHHKRLCDGEHESPRMSTHSAESTSSQPSDIRTWDPRTYGWV